jgi:hypothetical protein
MLFPPGGQVWRVTVSMRHTSRRPGRDNRGRCAGPATVLMGMFLCFVAVRPRYACELWMARRIRRRSMSR